jgi:hypothetical protein
MEIERGQCGVTGKVMFASKAEAFSDETSRYGFRMKRGKWAAKWCVFCEHIHLTKSAGPRRGKKDLEKVSRGKR